MSQLLATNGRLVCLEFPIFKDPLAGGPPWGVTSELYLEVLKNPGETCSYADMGFVIVSGGDSGKNGLKRLGHWKADRTLSYGAKTDWISVWGNI